MKKLIIIGAGGHGKVAADIAIRMGCYSEIAFLDDADIQMSMGIPVIGKADEYEKWISEAEFFVAIGDSTLRQKYMDLLTAKKVHIATLIHPNAVIGSSVKIGKGTVVMAGSVINPDTVIGDGVILNTASSVDHDNRIGDYCHIAVGAHTAGNVTVHEHTWIGAGAVIKNNLTICADCVIGAGAVVVKNIEEAGTYIGIPAKRMVKNA